jgi:uncharacterized repeat protein (TIGR01451 family)
VLGVTKSDGSATYTPGGAATYTVIVTNTGATDALSVQVADALPAGVTLAGTVTCAPSALSSCGVVTRDGGQAAFGATAAVIRGGGTLTFTVPVAFGIAMTDPSITNTATATATDPQLPPPGTVSAQGSDTDHARAGRSRHRQDARRIVLPRARPARRSRSSSPTNGPAPSFGTVTVTDLVPAGLTATIDRGHELDVHAAGGGLARAAIRLAQRSRTSRLR